MIKVKGAVLGILAFVFLVSCNNDMSGVGNRDSGSRGKLDRRQRTVIDASEYTDFTVAKNDAGKVKKEDLLYALNNGTFKNGNSIIKIKSKEGAVEISSDSGRYNGKENCQVYGSFSFDVMAASEDCLYLRKNPRVEGFVMIDGVMLRNDAMPDLAVCLPLYGYSRNRIEVSPVMDGYIVMPSGTYWKQ